MPDRSTLRRVWPSMLAASILATAVFGTSCGDGRPTDDLDYLVWEVCRQVRVEGVTADQVAGIIHDATRHGAVMAPIEAECGEDIAAVFATTSPGRQPPD